MVRWFALTLLAVLLAAALPPSPGVAQTGAPAPVTTVVATAATTVPPAAAPTAAEAARIKAEADAKAKKEKEDAEEVPKVGKMASLLAGVFALAAVIEAALAVVFSWPLFLDRINRRNSKMPISLALGIVTAFSLKLNLIDKLGTNFGNNPGIDDWLDAVISGLILAGGAAGVRNLMVSLGLATPTAEIEKPPRPPSNKAWLSITDGRDRWKRRTPLTIWLGQAAIGTAPATLLIAGVIPADTKPPSKFRKAFLTDKSRFPVVAGHPLPSGQSYDIYVLEGATVPLAGSAATWADFTFGEGAIVDLVFRSP